MPKKRSILSFQITQDLLKNIAGEYGFEVVRLSEKKGKRITDEELGKHIGVKITEIRAALNRLHYRGIACYNKTRNPKTGWYSYTWNIQTKRISELVLEQYAEEIQKLEKKKQQEKGYALFSCQKRCSNIPFEIAAEYQFKCPECGNTMDALDNEKNARAINKKIKLLMEEAKTVEKKI